MKKMWEENHDNAKIKPENGHIYQSISQQYQLFIFYLH